MRTQVLRRLSLSLFLMAAVLAEAGAQPLTITITKGVEAGIPIAIVPFAWEGPGAPPEQVSDVVEADLVRSGRVDALPRADFLSRPSDDKEVRFKDWRLLKAEALVVGKMRQTSADRFSVQFQLFDVFKGQQLTGRLYRDVPTNRLRRTAHHISDLVYEHLTGEKGAFNTRIAYVTLERNDGTERYRLVVSDADGFDPKTILESTEPIMSPAWSPDGTHLAYVSFEARNSNVYTQRLLDGAREKIAAFDGLNSAPAWSPDGTRLAMTLSRDGNAEIYVMDRATGRLERLTRHLAIDTEPAWSPDGKHIVFTSDRSGSPQIYRMSSSGGRPERLTFEGKYNARASYAAHGESLALITNRDGGFKVATFHLRSRSLHVLTRTRLDESPTFAPNGAMILYGTESSGGRGVLAAVSSDGRVQQTLTTRQGDVREPAWSPYNPNQ